MFRITAGHVAALVRSHAIGLLPFRLTKEQTTQTMDPSPKTIELLHYPGQWNLELTGSCYSTDNSITYPPVIPILMLRYLRDNLKLISQAVHKRTLTHKFLLHKYTDPFCQFVNTFCHSMKNSVCSTTHWANWALTLLSPILECGKSLSGGQLAGVFWWNYTFAGLLSTCRPLGLCWPPLVSSPVLGWKSFGSLNIVLPLHCKKPCLSSWMNMTGKDNNSLFSRKLKEWTNRNFSGFAKIVTFCLLDLILSRWLFFVFTINYVHMWHRPKLLQELLG